MSGKPGASGGWNRKSVAELKRSRSYRPSLHAHRAEQEREEAARSHGKADGTADLGMLTADHPPADLSRNQRRHWREVVRQPMPPESSLAVTCVVIALDVIDSLQRDLARARRKRFAERLLYLKELRAWLLTLRSLRAVLPRPLPYPRRANSIEPNEFDETFDDDGVVN